MLKSPFFLDGLFEHQYKGVYDTFAKEIVPSDEKTFLHVMDDQKRIATIRTRQGLDPDDPTPNTKYFLDDHLGSSSIVLDNDGLLVNREEYYPFGETSFGSFAKKRYRFCGKERDGESGF